MAIVPLPGDALDSRDSSGEPLDLLLLRVLRGFFLVTPAN